jgi:hypothetical protein
MATVYQSILYIKVSEDIAYLEIMTHPLNMNTRSIVIFSKTYEILSMKYLWPSTINTQTILFKFYCLTELLGSVDLSNISIYNEAKYNEFYNISAFNISCMAYNVSVSYRLQHYSALILPYNIWYSIFGPMDFFTGPTLIYP